MNQVRLKKEGQNLNIQIDLVIKENINILIIETMWTNLNSEVINNVAEVVLLEVNTINPVMIWT